MTMLEQTRQALAAVPASHTPTGWSMPRHLWTRLILNRDAAGLVAFTEDPAHPTLHGLPVTVVVNGADGFVLHTAPVVP